MAGQGQGQPQIPNINTLAAQGIKGAGYGTANEMGYRPQQVQSGQLSSTNLSPYMNPYTTNVIQANEADILRGAQMGMNELGSQATAAKAFGGSRHGIATGELGRNVVQQLAQSSAGLRQQGFQNAQQMAQQDIQGRMTADLANQGAGLSGSQQRLNASNQLGNIANLGFGMGQTVQQNLSNQGMQQQAMQQALIDAAKQKWQGHTNAPVSGLGFMNAALGASPVPQTTTETKQPGLFDYLTMWYGNKNTGG